jgi:hypothetical protein
MPDDFELRHRQDRERQVAPLARVLERQLVGLRHVGRIVLASSPRQAAIVVLDNERLADDVAFGGRASASGARNKVASGDGAWWQIAFRDTEEEA